MKFSPVALSLGVSEILEGLSTADFPLGFEKIVDAGWLVDDDAVLLRRFLDSYHGDRGRFADVVGYEAAVNGRGIPDLDLDPSSPDATLILLRRGVAFAWQALHKAYTHEPRLDVSAYVSVSP